MLGETEFQVTARLEPDGEPAIKVTAFRSYGSRKASVSENVTDEKLLSQLSGIFGKAVNEVRESLQKEVNKAVVEAAYVAGQRGEDV